jgi:hypothetical protein
MPRVSVPLWKLTPTPPAGAHKTNPYAFFLTHQDLVDIGSKGHYTGLSSSTSKQFS